MHAGMIGKNIIETLARVDVDVQIASEFRYCNPIFHENDLMMVISQSGETADTLAALRLAKQQGITTLAVVNVVGSSIAREQTMLFTPGQALKSPLPAQRRTRYSLVLCIFLQSNSPLLKAKLI